MKPLLDFCHPLHRIWCGGLLWVAAMAISTNLLASAPPNSRLQALLEDIPKLNAALQEDPNLLSGTKLRNRTLNGLVLKHAKLKYLNWRNVRLKNPTFEDVTLINSSWHGVKFWDANFNKVTFEQVLIGVNSQLAGQSDPETGGNSFFIGGQMQQVKFLKSTLKSVWLLDLKASSIQFIKSNLTSERRIQGQTNLAYVSRLDNSLVKLSLIRSTFDIGPKNLKYPSEVVMEQSTIKQGGVGGELKRLEVHSSHFVGKTGDKADYVFIEKSSVGANIPNAKWVYLKDDSFIEGGSYPQTTSVSFGKVGTALVEDCQTPLSPAIENVDKFYIKDCQIIEFVAKNAQVNEFNWCEVSWNSANPSSGPNAALWLNNLKNAKISQWNLYDSQITGELPLTESLYIDSLKSDSVSQLPKVLQLQVGEQSHLASCPPWPKLD